MRKETIELYGKTAIRVTKKTAETAYNKGKTIYLCPVNGNPNSPWINALPIQLNDENTFSNQVNNYEYYNCINELGRYCKFYIGGIEA